MIRSLRYACAIGLLVGFTACSHLQPKSPVPAIALAIPAPPERQLVPVDLPEPEPEPAVATETPVPPPAPVRPRETVARPAPTPVPATAAAPVEATPPPVIQTTTQTSQVEQKIQATLAVAKQGLDNVKYVELGPEARKQFDQARAFIQQAENNLKARKYAFAEAVANKAADIARMLGKG
ncbi:MAG: hypothetical protein ABI634_01640 [Acidobacteriota bacterium]